MSDLFNTMTVSSYYTATKMFSVLILGLQISISLARSVPKWEEAETSEIETSNKPSSYWAFIKSPANDETIECTEAFLILERNSNTQPGSIFVIFVDRVYVASGSLPHQLQSTTISLRSLKPGPHTLQLFSADKQPPTLLDQVRIHSECRDIERPFSEPTEEADAAVCAASRSAMDMPPAPLYLVSRIPPLALNPVMPELHGVHRRCHRCCRRRRRPFPPQRDYTLSM
jgi:hypothetical protein